jgi:hypothetical protein
MKANLTPDITQNKLNGGISLMLPIKTYSHGGCRYSYRTNVMKHGYRRELCTEDELEYVHGDEDLVENEQNYMSIRLCSSQRT